MLTITPSPSARRRIRLSTAVSRALRCAPLTTLLTTLLTALTLVGGAQPATAQVAFGAPCGVLQERLFDGAERSNRTDWGQTLVVRSTIRIDCRGTSEPFDAATVEFTLPDGMTVFRIVEEDVDGNDVARDIDPPERTVRLTAALDRAIGWTIVERWYHVNVRPVVGELSAADEMRVTWDETVALQSAGRPVVRLDTVPMQALIVRRSRPDADCPVAAERSFGPLAPDGTVTVTLRLLPRRCQGFAPRVQALLAFPPPRSAGEATTTLTAAQGFAGRLGPDEADLGALVAYAGRQLLARPQADTGPSFALLAAAASGPPADAEVALRAALAALDPPPLGHGVVWLIGRADVPASRPGAVATVLGQADRRGIEVVGACLGGGCDPAVPWAYTLPDLTALRFAWLGGAAIAHRGAPLTLVALRVTEDLEGATYAAGSARIDEVPVAPDITAGRVAFTMDVVPDVARTLTYAMRLSTPAGTRFTGRGTVRGVYANGTARHEGLEVRLPRAMLASGSPPTEATACRPRTTKTAAPTSILLGDALDVRLTVQTTCSDVLRRSDVVALIDTSRSSARASAVDVRMAFRRMLWAVESPETHVSLITFDRRVTRRLPLSRNYLGVHFLIDDIYSLWYDMFHAGQLRVGLDAAQEELAFRRPDAEARVVVMTGGEGDTAAYRLSAQRLKAQGARVSVFCTPTGCPEALSDVASSPKDYAEVDAAALTDVLQTFSDFGALLRELRVASVVVQDRLAEGMALEPGSAVPPPDAVDGQTLTWRFDGPDLPVNLAIGYRVIPAAAGRWPVSETAEAAVVDELGRAGRAPFPPVEAVVYPLGDAGPCTPRLSREPFRTVIHSDDVVTTTLRAALDCPARKARLDMVLAIDHSDSMRFGDRLANAVAAAGAFLDALDPAEVHVGLVAFGTDVTLRMAPTDDYAAVRQALGTIEPNGQTAIARALQVSGELLAARRPDSLPALVLLTDGEESSGNVQVMLAAAQRLKDDHVTIATVCAGTCDPELAQVASRPDLAYDVADSAQLVGLYGQLAAEFATARPRDIRVVDAYAASARPVRDAILPEPDRVLVDQVDWSFDELPETGLEIAVGMVPTVLEGTFSPVRFALLEYTYGAGAGSTGRAFFPPIELAFEAPPDPTAVPTVTVPPTPRPEPRFVFLPWGAR